MSYQGFSVIDSDMHLMEPFDLWDRYIDSRFKQKAPQGHPGDHPRLGYVSLPGKENFRPEAINWFEPLKAHMEPYTTAYAFAVERNWDSISQLQAMDKEGIDISVNYPTRALTVLGTDTTEQIGERGLEPEFAAAIARAYNDWLFDFCGADRKRLLAAALIAPHDPELAVVETRRCVQELGFKAVFLAPGIVNRRPWYHPAYDAIWAECEKLDVPVVFHGTGPDSLTDFSLGLMQYLMMQHQFLHVLGPMMAAVCFCAGGVFERFPRLRLGLLEANCSWAPWFFGRLDDHYTDYIGKFEVKLSKKPSEYFLTNCYVSVETEERTISQYVEWFGDDNVVFSTDYPHPDSRFPRSVEAFMKLPLSKSSQRKVLWENCARFYGL
jgi:uncharacterized protein